MKLHELQPAEGSKKRRKRVGRGISAGQGKTAGRGTKGQKARTGSGIKPYFEGGQLPLVRRLPHTRGFTNIFKVNYQVVNLDTLNNKFDSGAEVNPAALVEHGLIDNAENVKVLGRGELKKALTVYAHAFSEGAREKITAAGGKAEVVGSK
jgi:large subunit ribosomal protein L15